MPRTSCFISPDRRRARPGLSWLGVAALALPGLAGTSSAEEAMKLAGPEWSRSLPVYEAEIGRCTKEGTFAAFERVVPDLADLGVGIVWLMPIHPRSGNPEGKPRSDSPYCVRDHTDVDPRYGTKADFKRLVDAIHASGMYVILDFVANHTSWGNPLITEHPDWYRKNERGEIVQAGPWADIAQLDYSRREVWEYMFRARRQWVVDFGVDGFREDVAGMVPIEHWEWLRPKLDEAGAVFMLAEADEPRHHPAFDATYDWTLQPYMYMIARGDWPATSIDRLLARERERYPRGAVRMRHLTNHDMHGAGSAWPNRHYLDKSEVPFLESRPLSAKYAGGARAFTVLCATLPGSKPMLWNGQELGIIGPTPWPIEWRDCPEREFHRKLLHAFRENPAFWEGDFERAKTSADERVYAFARRAGANRVFVALNLSKDAQAVTLDAPAAAGSYTDVFSGRRRRLGARARLEIEPWGYELLVSGTPRRGKR